MRQISYYYHTTPFEDILKELQKRKRRKNPPNPFWYRIDFWQDFRETGIILGLTAVMIQFLFWELNGEWKMPLGYYTICAVLVILGILSWQYSKRTWIEVIDDGERDDSRMIFHCPFRSEEIMRMNQISEVKLVKNSYVYGSMYIYDEHRTPKFCISHTANNFELLSRNLEWHNKKITEVAGWEMEKELMEELRKHKIKK